MKANGVCIEKNQAFCNHGCHKNIFKQNIIQILAWDNTDAEMLFAISKKSCKRSEAVVEANGGYIEQK